MKNHSLSPPSKVKNNPRSDAGVVFFLYISYINFLYQFFKKTFYMDFLSAISAIFASFNRVSP